MATQLTFAGYKVWEAASVSEVLYLCEHDKVDAIVIGADMEDQELIELHLGQTTLKLKEGTKAEDLIWELSNLFPSQSSMVQ